LVGKQKSDGKMFQKKVLQNLIVPKTFSNFVEHLEDEEVNMVLTSEESKKPNFIFLILKVL
jgi:hypothetical protein